MCSLTGARTHVVSRRRRQSSMSCLVEMVVELVDLEATLGVEMVVEMVESWLSWFGELDGELVESWLNW